VRPVPTRSAPASPQAPAGGMNSSALPDGSQTGTFFGAP